MTPHTPPPAPSDSELVAYLDGELSPADSVRIGQLAAADARLAARVEGLMKGGRPFRDAFAPLLEQAPTERLDAMVSGLLARPLSGRRSASPRRLWPAAMAAGLAVLTLGAGLDRFAAPPLQRLLVAATGRDDEAADWRRAVAQYLSLYTRDTLSIIPDSEGARWQELASVGGRLGLDLDPARVQFPDMSLKRAEMFDYEGRTLAFLAYLDPRTGPVALCVIAEGGPDMSARVEHRRGMTVVYWSTGGRGFMLVGHGPAEDLQARARIVASRFGGTAIQGTPDDRG